jgi:hypothetical protein
MRNTKEILTGFCVYLFLNFFLCHVYGKDFFDANISTYIPDTSVNISAVQVADSNVYFTDSYGIHYQCDYHLSIKGFIRLSDGTRIWVEIEGKGSPLLLIQGVPGNVLGNGGQAQAKPVVELSPTNPVTEDNTYEIDHIYISSSRSYPVEFSDELDGQISEVIFTAKTQKSLEINNEAYQMDC